MGASDAILLGGIGSVFLLKNSPASLFIVGGIRTFSILFGGEKKREHHPFNAFLMKIK